MAEGHSGRFILVLAVALFAFVGGIAFRSIFQDNSQPPPPPMNYTTLICDDAYQTGANHQEEDVPYIDVTLKAGCFSGFVVIPRKWNTWQGQLLHNDPTDWAAYWFQGQYKPRGPFPEVQVNSVQDFGTVGPGVRLQGKGTLRFYRITP